MKHPYVRTSQDVEQTTGFYPIRPIVNVAVRHVLPTVAVFVSIRFVLKDLYAAQPDVGMAKYAPQMFANH